MRLIYLLKPLCLNLFAYEPRCEKTGLRGFRPGPTQTGLYSHRRWLEALNFGFTKERDCTIRVAKTKVLISCADTAQLICALVFAYAKIRFSHDEAHILKSKKCPKFNENNHTPTFMCVCKVKVTSLVPIYRTARTVGLLPF